MRSEHVQPVLAQISVAARGARARKRSISPAPSIRPVSCSSSANALQGGVQIQPRGAVADQELEPGLGVDPDDHPANIEDNVADQTGIYRSGVVPAVMFTDTTVARGKKLNSEALAQV